MEAEDLSHDEMSKDHARYMVGGKVVIENERVFRFGEFSASCWVFEKETRRVTELISLCLSASLPRSLSEFPERPNALFKFLHSMHDAKIDKPWNISMFHYRNHGSGSFSPLPSSLLFLPRRPLPPSSLSSFSDLGKVLIGIQVSPSDYDAFDVFLEELAYPYKEETNNPVYLKYLKV